MNKKKFPVIKRFAIRFLPVAVFILAVAVIVHINQRAQYVESVRSNELSMIYSDYITMTGWLESGIEDVSFLAGLVEKKMCRAGASPACMDDIADTFTTFAQENRNCVQVRLLSSQGQELVRINVEEGKASRVEKKQLQDKSGRDYFRDSKGIGKGVYVSAFDLNIEFGKISEPRLPVIRFMKNIFGRENEPLGVLVINLSGNSLLEFIKKTSESSFGWCGLANKSGGWLVAPERSLDWLFLFGEKSGYMMDTFPHEWELIRKGNSGQFTSGEGLFTYDTVKPSSFSSSFKHNVIFNENWKIIGMVDESNLVAPFSNVTIALFGLLYLMSGFFFWRMTVSTLESEKMREALEESERRFMDVADAAGEFIWETGPDGCFVFVTGRAGDILGYSAEELIGRSPFDFVDEESSWEVRKEFLDAAHNGNSFNGLVFKFVNREGRKLWLEFNGVPVFDAQGTVTGFRGATSDITAQQKALQDLTDRENMLQSISDSVQDALVLMDENGLVHFWNQAAESIFGYTSEEMLGESLRCCILEEDNEDISGTEEGADGVEGLFSRHGSFTVNVRRKTGKIFPAEVLLSPLRKDEQWWVVGTIRDVTERKEAEDKLRKLATTDPLTGLANRRHFMESAEEALERSLRYGHELSLMMMDIDFFKNVNDMYGHDAGDDVLKGLAAAGLKILRQIDVFGRIGGEEFSILLPDTGLEGARIVAERLRQEIEKTRMITRSGELTITVSIGVANLNEQTRSLEHLLKAADIGLYAAKHAGRNRVEIQISPDGSVEKK
ncbi:diguanylate cyclase [Maridesulfovibrio sp.]|uniref:sensor domain-containing diguanylate cyclase n=1 Tax=Maridesulfovibrio sp. TaxID=2795000 RepID=UPI002A187DA5|nr:diguanylate cyclase [Maridesulfovibrio sp.]